MKDPSTSAKVQ